MEFEASVTPTSANNTAMAGSLASDVRDWVVSSPGVFESSLVATELSLSSRVDTKNLSKILGRLMKEGLIERVGKKRGVFRLIDKSEEEIDWYRDSDTEGLDIRWPLGIEERFEIMPGSAVVIAGETNCGKTAMMLDLARLNMTRLPTVYFGSSAESNGRTLRKRIEAFHGDPPLEIWQERLKAISRPGQFADVIRPDALNLIDYLEIHDDFYLVGQEIASIHQRLNDGLAFIALQKNPDKPWGRGGALTMDKAAVYITIKCEAKKGEYPLLLEFLKIKYPLIDRADEPIRFKLNGGCQFIPAVGHNKGTAD